MSELQAQTNSQPRSLLAFISFWFGIVSLFPGLGLIFVAPAIIIGILALVKIKKTREAGQGFAKAAIVLGILGILLTLYLFRLFDALKP